VESEVRPAAVTAAGSGWIVSPAFDLLFLSNLGWLLLLVPEVSTAEGLFPITFWQIYFLTTPHRWITLFIVAADPDRREGRGRLFLAIAAAAFLSVFAVRHVTGTFLCLLLIDYVWNGWHFASQHSGVLRMYTRKVGGGWHLLERHGLRLFIFYVIALTAGWSTGWLEVETSWQRPIAALSLGMLAIPVLLLLTSGIFARQRLGKFVYLSSVCLLYSMLLIALQENNRPLVAALATASSLFHAVEYLAVVTHYARRRHTIGSDGAFRVMAHNWLRLLALYLIAFGMVAASVELGGIPDWWIGLNVAVAFLHYTFDGMIWKLRRPATAQALGVS
jgi:hypothetical protein